MGAVIKASPHADPVSVQRLKGLVEEIETSRERQQNETKQQRDIFAKAKTLGFDTKAMRKVIQRRAMKAEDRENLDLLIDTYECALASKRLAADALSGGASVREAAKASGLSVGSVAALRVVQNTKQIERPHHDPETGEISQPSQAANGGGDHDGGLLKQPMAEVARVAPPSMPSSAPVAASGSDIGIPDAEDLGVAAGAGPFGSQETTDGQANEDTGNSRTHVEAGCAHDRGVGGGILAGIPGRNGEGASEVENRTAAAERFSQEVVGVDPRPEGTPIADDLAIPAFLDQRKRQVNA